MAKKAEIRRDPLYRNLFSIARKQLLDDGFFNELAVQKRVGCHLVTVKWLWLREWLEEDLNTDLGPLSKRFFSRVRHIANERRSPGKYIACGGKLTVGYIDLLRPENKHFHIYWTKKHSVTRANGIIEDINEKIALGRRAGFPDFELEVPAQPVKPEFTQLDWVVNAGEAVAELGSPADKPEDKGEDK